MFGIVALHCAYVTLGSFTWENNIWKWCVDGFAFISGYCCIRQFSLKKVFRLYLQALFCLVMMETFNVVFNGVSFAWGVRVWRVFCDLWFLHAYVFLMAVASADILIREGLAFLKPGGSLIVYRTREQYDSELDFLKKWKKGSFQSTELFELPDRTGTRMFLQIRSSFQPGSKN